MAFVRLLLSQPCKPSYAIRSGCLYMEAGLVDLSGQSSFKHKPGAHVVCHYMLAEWTLPSTALTQRASALRLQRSELQT